MKEEETPIAETSFSGVPRNASVEPSHGTPVAQFVMPPSSSTIAIGKASQVHSSRNFLLVGRQAATCDIRIGHKSLSRQHALLYYHNDKLYVQDLGAKSGTFVQSQRLAANEPRELVHGDAVQWGKAQPLFQVQWKSTHSHTRSDGAAETVPNDEATLNTATTDTGTQQNGIGIETAETQEPVLTGRAQRQAEIAAMMASLEEAPTYTKYEQPASIQAPPPSAIQQSQSDSALAKLHKHKVPITSSTALTRLEDSSISAVSMDPSGARFAIGGMDSTLRLYDFAGVNADNALPFSTLHIQEGYPLRSISYSSTGDRFVVATTSAQPIMYDRDGQELQEWARGDVYVTDPTKTSGHTASVTAVAWHALEKSIVLSTSKDGSLRSWNVDKGKLTFSKLTHDDVLLVKNLKTGRKTFATSCTTSPGMVAIGTECGSLQLFRLPFTSKLRPQQSVAVVHNEEPVVSVLYSPDKSRLAVRTTTSLSVWDTSSAYSKLSNATIPLLKLENLSPIDETMELSSSPTMAFSGNGKVMLVGESVPTSGSSHGVYSNCMKAYIVPKEAKSKTPKAIFTCPLESSHLLVGILWHSKLNQILVATKKDFQFWYSEEDSSSKGVLMSRRTTRRKRNSMEDDLQNMYAKRAPPPGSSVRYEEIVAPNALPMFGGGQRHKRKKISDEDDKERNMPQKPAKDIYTTNNTIFAQMVVDQQSSQKVIAGKDPRAALAQYVEGKSFISRAYDGNKEHVLAEKTLEEEAEGDQGKD